MINNSFDIVLDKFQKALMGSGQKSNSNLIMKDLISKIIIKNDDPQDILTKSVENIKPLFVKEIKALFGTMYSENSSYIKARNFYRFYLLVYLVLFLLYQFYGKS